MKDGRLKEEVWDQWEEEDGLTTLLPENGGDWWDVSLRNDPPIGSLENSLANLMWRWSLFECPVRCS